MGGGGISPHSIINAKTSWEDDNGKRYSCILKGVLYFPDSPVNIVSVTSLADQLDNETGAWIKISRDISEFTWNQE